MALRLGGFTLLEIQAAGFQANKLLEAGFTADQLQSTFKMNELQMKAAGCTVEELRVS